MNWVSTNIRFPEDQYRKLKIRAVNERKSLAKIIREAVSTNNKKEEKIKKRKIKDVDKFMKEVERLGRSISKEVGKDFDSVKALREIRYSE